MFFGWFVILALISLVPAWIARSKGRSFWGWWFYALFLFPITLIHSVAMSSDVNRLEERQLQSGNKKCPACAELIKQEAVLCKHCGTEQGSYENAEVSVINTEGAAEVYEGQPIHEIPGGFTALGSWFKSIKQAKSYIDKNPNLWH